MGKLTRSGSQSSSRLLARILDRPELVAVVDQLSPKVLGRLIDHVGLEDAGELVAAASTPQLQRVWDRDLWRHPENGAEERFDPERFALWLAVLLEGGEAQLVRRLRELPLDLLTLGVHRLVHVVDTETWSQAGDDEDEPGSGLHAPFHELVLVARDEHGWGAVLSALLALDGEDHALVRRILDRCRALDAEAGGERDELSSALPVDLALESDVAAERDARQAAKGYIASADARAFLRLARAPLGQAAATLARDPVTRAYFRELESEQDETAGAQTQRGGADERERPRCLPDASTQPPAALSSLLALLARSGVVSPSDAQAAAPMQLGAGAAQDAEVAADDAAAATLLHAALEALAPTAPAVWSERMEELGYLANVILSGCTRAAQPFSEPAALEASAAVTSLGLELQLDRRGHTVSRAAGVLQAVSADRLFRAGYAALAPLVREARSVLRRRCAAYALPELRAGSDEALGGDELGAFPEELTAELLHLTPAEWEALHGLAESVPALAAELAEGGARFVTTGEELRRAQGWLHALSG